MKKIIFTLILILILSGGGKGNIFAKKMLSPAIDLDNQPFSYFREPITVLGIKDGPEGSEVTPEGTIYTGNAELLFFVGSYPFKINQRVITLYKGYLPIVNYKYFYDDIHYYFQMFAYTLDGKPESNLINFVKVTVSNETKEEKKAYLWIGICFRDTGKRFNTKVEFNNEWIYEMKDNYVLRDGKLIYTFSESKNRDLFSIIGEKYKGKFKGAEFFVLKNTPVCLVKYYFKLKPQEKEIVYIKMPYTPSDSKKEIESIKKANYDDYFQKTVKFWEDILKEGIEIYLPEEKVINTFKTSLIYDLIARDKVGNEYIQKVNEFQYDAFWLRDSSFIVRGYDLYGLHKVAEETLLHFLKYQQEDGNFVSQGGQFDGWGQSLWTFGQHYRITGDKEFAKKIYPYVKKAVEWLKKTRENDPLKIMPETAPGDNELIKGHVTGHNFWALLGLRNAIYLAEAVGEKQDLENFKSEYEDFYNTFIKILRRVTDGTGGYIPPGLDVQGGQDWGNLIGVYPTEVLEPNDLMVSVTLSKVREKFREGIMTYLDTIFLHHYLTEYVTQTELVRGNQRQVLEDFYYLLVHTSSANAGFEWRIPAWGDRDFAENFSPHGWFAAKYIALLRNMLIREENNKLHLLSVVSPQWLKDGEEIRIKNAPTNFGKISFNCLSLKDKLVLNIESNYRIKPENIVIHLPFFIKVKRIFIEGKEVGLTQIKDNRLKVSPQTRRIEFIIDIENIKDLNYESYVLKYRDEYIRRYTDYIKNINKEKYLRIYKK